MLVCVVEDVFGRIAAARFPSNVLLKEETASTNADAKTLQSAGLQPPFIVLAKKQSAAYGQRGNAWKGDAIGNLYLSCAVKITDRLEKNLEIFPQHIAISLCEIFRTKYFARAMVKWPNDIFVRSKKMGGLLLETVWNREKLAGAVLGIGVNILSAPKIDGESYEATCLADETKIQLEFDVVVGECITSVLSAVSSFEEVANYSICEKWKRFDGLNAQTIDVAADGEVICGKNCGIGENGELIIFTSAGEFVEIKQGCARIKLSGKV
ncbi:MAG: biotin--[acetyl-CoA-carboxylase] ligase [Puniceicoccales bacterium]|jgi:BirA family biotin operon repressor/biotin-[acetyl-CoA-carboxylase] ligase|nr:biotin--[acetyl-CoA-carboxylase] ligase [Puniceicoccales bacterium]